MSKRNQDMMSSDAKRALVGNDTEQVKWLPKHLASDEAMFAYAPSILKKEFTWQEDVECILAEQYSVFVPKLDSDSTQLKDGKAHARSLSFKGVCPFHGVIHSNNHWSLINTRGYNTTLFICHHGNVRRLIQARLPFPLED